MWQAEQRQQRPQPTHRDDWVILLAQGRAIHLVGRGGFRACSRRTGPTIPYVGRIFAAFAALLAATAGCSSPTATDTATTTSKTTHAAPALTPKGFGATPPNSEQLRDFGAWTEGPGKGAKAATDEVGKAVDRLSQAAAAGDLTGLRNACPDVADPLTTRLPASLPTPDQDLTNSLRLVIYDATVLKEACDALGNTPTENQIDRVFRAIHDVGRDMQTLGDVIMRDSDLLRSEAEAPR